MDDNHFELFEKRRRTKECSHHGIGLSHCFSALRLVKYQPINRLDLDAIVLCEENEFGFSGAVRN